jgi:hypothetical protein
MKFLGKAGLALLLIFAAAVVAMLLCIPAEGREKKTQPQWTVVFGFHQGNVPGPDVRIYVLVNGTVEGEAAIAAHKHLSEKLTVQAAEKLMYLESQRKQ